MAARLAEVLLRAEEPFGLALLRTEHELQQEPFLPERCQVLYGAGGGGCTGLASEECVVAYKNQVIWTAGPHVRKRFTASSDILQVCWAHFGRSQGSDTQASSAARQATGTSGARHGSHGAAPDSGVRQRTPGAATPAPAGGMGAAGFDAAGLDSSHLPTWWTAGNGSSARSAGGASAMRTPAPAAAAAVGAGGKAGQHDPLASQDATPAAGPTAAEAAAGGGGGPGGSSLAGSVDLGQGSSSPSPVSEAVLCLLLRNSISCIFPTGELLECPLLQPCQALWPLPTGVLLAGPSEAFASVLTHPLEEPLPVVADCSLSTAANNSGRGMHVSISTPAAYAGWSQERVVWSSRELPFVATHNEDRGRLSIWHMRPQPVGPSGIGSAYDLPALSPFGLGPMRTPVAAAAMAAGAHTSNSLPTFGTVNSAGTAAAGAQAAGLGSAGAHAGTAAGAAAGYVGGPAAYSGSMLGMLASGGVTPWSGPRSFARMSAGASTVKRSGLRSPAGRLPASIFSATPNPQNLISGALGALGPLRPAFSNTTTAQQALLLPGPDPSLLFKLVWRQDLAGGLLPDSAVQATDAAGQPLLCVLCTAAQQLLAFQLPGDVDASPLLVKPAFSTAALAAIPVTTGAYAGLPDAASSSSSNSGGSGGSGVVRTRPLIDLLVLQPAGQLVLFRGPAALVTVRLLLPHGHLQQLQDRLAAAAAFRQRWLRQQRQQHEGSPAFGGSRRSSGMQDAELTAPTGPPPGSQPPAAGICGLSCASRDRFDVHLQLGDSQVSLRARLGVSWLPGLPTQVLQALGEVLEAPCFNRLLAACLTQPGACCGELSAEWTVIAGILLAWALQPECLDAVASSSSSPSSQPWQHQAAAGGTSPATPRAAGTAADGGDSDADMEMATPAAPQAAAAGARTPHQQQLQTPGSEMDMSVDMAMSVDTASAATPVGQLGPGRYQRELSGTPMSLSNTPMSVTSKVASRLRHQSSYRQDYGQQPQQQQQPHLQGAGADRAQQPAAGYDAADIFPTATPTGATASRGAAAEAAAVAAAQQSFGQLQLPQTPQLAAQAAATAPADAWQQLLQSADSSQLLQQLPWLEIPPQAAAGPGLQQQPDKQHAPSPDPQQLHQQQQQQQPQHRHDVATVLLALHSVYEDCKLSRLRLHLLQLLGPVCWLLATWLDAPLYREQFEREAASAGIAAAAGAYLSAAQGVLSAVGSSSGAVGALGAGPLPHLAAAGQAGTTAAAADANGTAQQQQQVSVDAEQLLQQPPGDILKCLSLLLSASQQYQSYVPLLAATGSHAVLKSLQLLQLYKVLAGCASKCAAAIACDAADRLAGGPAQHSTQTPEWLRRSSGSRQQAALVSELQHVLLQCSQQLVLLLVEQGWDVLALDQLPVGVALPIKEALARCRGSPPVGWPVMAYALIGREDIAATLASSSSAPAATRATGVALSASPPAHAPDKPRQLQPFDPGSVTDTAQQHQQAQHLLLPYEQRLLLPSGSFLTGHQHHQRLPSAAGRSGAARRGPSQHSRPAYTRGLRSSGAPAGAAMAAAAGGAAGGSAAAAAGGKAGGMGGADAVPIDGMEGLVNGVSALRFSRDDRLAEARSLLGTNMPVIMQAVVSESDPELPAKQQASLLTAAMRTMALPLGRGALTLGLAEPLPGEHVAVPLLCLSGIVPCPAGENGPNSGRIMVNLDLTNAQPAPGGGAAAEVTAWCEFHNGVAAGLKIAPYTGSRNKQHQQQQTRQQGPGRSSGSGMASSREGSGAESLSESWLPHSKPAVPNYAHAGVLLALGLNGHLSRLSWTDLYRYLSDQHDATTIGVLLGMSAACRGTADSTVARMLFLHLPARHPNTFPEIELSPHVQAASLLGLGLLYQGSCHRLMTETVLEEMCRTPGVNPHAGAMPGQDGAAGLAGASLSALMSVTHDREGYALAAGFGLGLICLGQGRNAPGLADLHLEDRLRGLMDAQVQPHTIARTQHAPKGASDASKPGGSSSSAAGAPGQRVRNLLDHVLGDGVVPWSVEAGDDPTGLAAAAAAAGGVKVDADQMQQYGISQVVLEGPVVNTAGTGPAAAMALMMTYLKTGDAGVAALFKVPDTAYALDHMRPDMVLLMVLGKSLILWDTIEPTEDWLHSQLSPLLDHPLQTILDNQASPPAPARSSSTGGGSAEPGARAAGTQQQQAAVDWGAVGLAHVNAIAGGCFAVGLRFAGTCSAQAEFLLRGQLLALLSAKRRAPGGSTSNAVAAATAAAAAGVTTGAPVGIGYLPPGAACIGQLDKAALEDAIVVVLLSLSLVMAGSGHLPTFRLVQMLSRRVAAPLRPPGQPAGPDGQPGGPIAAVLGGAGVGTNSLHYGHHLAVSLAAGLLFLSGGRSSLSTSNEAIAALLIALYPVWPCTPTDQRCHLQAFRHLYALAAEPRCLEALDVHSRRQVVVPLSVTARTAGLAGAAAAAHHKQQQQQKQGPTPLRQRAQAAVAASAAGVAGVMAPAAGAAAAGSPGPAQQGQQQQGPDSDGMVWSPRQADPAAPAAVGHQGLPPPAFAKAAGGGRRPGVAITPPLRPGLPPISPQGGPAAAAGGGAGVNGVAAAGSGGSSEGADDTISLRLQAPCLLPEQQHLVSLRVCGPRYWAVELAAGAPSSSSSSSRWSQPSLQHRICVKKKAGSLSYTDDHTGVKSLLFKAFYAGGSNDILAGSEAAAAAAEAGDEDGNQAPASRAPQQQQPQQQHSFDITQLCQTFAADPQIQAFAQVLQAANAAAGAGGSGSSSSRFLTFCNGALYECVVQEKTSTLPAYLQLHAVVQQVCASALGGEGSAAAPAAVGSTSSSRGGGSGCSAALLGCAAPAGPGLLLQDLVLVLGHYSSSTAVAAGMCRAAQHSALAAGAQGQAGQQQAVDVLMWQPLLQPGFCSSLFATLMQSWRAVGVLPQELALDNSSGADAARSSSLLCRYMAAGSIAAAAQAGLGVAGGPVVLQRQREQLLAGCLAALQLPAAVQLQGLLQAALSDAEQQQGQQQGALGDAAAVLALMTGGQGRCLVQDVPARSLMVLASALREALSLQGRAG